jgi:hypothetical protein
VLSVLQRQLEADPQKFGFSGDVSDKDAVEAWAQHTALKAAREDNIVRFGGDTRLSAQAIGHLAIVAEPSQDGIDIMFTNENGLEINLDQVRENDFTYEHLAAPGQIPSQDETAIMAETVASTSPQPIEIPATEEITDKLAGGEVRLFVEDGKIDGVSLGDAPRDAKDAISAMINASQAGRLGIDGERIATDVYLLNSAIKELEEAGDGNGVEASFLRGQLTVLLTQSGTVLDGSNPIVSEAAQEARVFIATAPAQVQETMANDNAPPDAEPMRRFFGESGKVKFLYDRDGNVRDAFIPAYIPKPAAVDSALSQFGLDRNELVDHFIQKRGTWEHPTEREMADYVTNEKSSLDMSARAEYGRFISRIERLVKQEATLQEMQERGLDTTPEYVYWKDETERFREFVERRIEKEVPSK